jgi:hypothetical protein
VAFFATISGVRAQTDTSYLLIQGPFGSGGSTATYKWQVKYPEGSLMTSQDLLNTVFGTPVPDGTLQGDYTFGQVSLYAAGNSTQGATYVYYPPSQYFPTASLFTYAIALSSSNVSTNDNVPTGVSTRGWNMYVDGGDVVTTGTWNYSMEGQSGRGLSNDSFDAWVYGDTGSDPGYSPAGTMATVDGAANDPVAADFADATVINVPEPASLALLAAGAAALGVFALTRKRTA